MKSLVEKAEILIEALPYIRRFFGKTIVIKYGGHAMLEPELRESFARDVVLLKYVGMKPVVVHGGGPQIATQLERMGKKAEFVDGLRVTDDETMEVVEMVLGGTVNREIVGLVQRAGGRAAGLTGCDGSLLRVEKKLKNGRDIGRVGHVIDVDPTALEAVSEGGFVPVIAPIGLDENGQTYNVNADEAAGAIAVALGAEKFILLTDVEGVADGEGNRISQLTEELARKLIAEEVIGGGMIPKVECCLGALEGGVSRSHIIDGRVLHAILLEMFTDDAGVGTLFVV